ncbi:MAG TPA: hypothetical protein VFT22_32230 [Kofleriaceae bacterium]|nr:hypothetical protein [Kofleriaceae bacterium]
MAIWTAIAAIATTASAVAFADPPRPTGRDEPRVYDRDYDHDRDRDRDREVYLPHDHYDRYAQSHWAREFRGRWVPIARGNTRNQRALIPLDARFRRLRIEGLRGEPVIERITVEFANGGVQSVYLNAALPRGTGEVIDLTGDQRRVRRIIVDASPGSRGAYTVWGA